MKEEVMTCLQSLYASHIINTPKVATFILGLRQEEHKLISTATTAIINYSQLLNEFYHSNLLM